MITQKAVTGNQPAAAPEVIAQLNRAALAHERLSDSLKVLVQRLQPVLVTQPGSPVDGQPRTAVCDVGQRIEGLVSHTQEAASIIESLTEALGV